LRAQSSESSHVRPRACGIAAVRASAIARSDGEMLAFAHIHGKSFASLTGETAASATVYNAGGPKNPSEVSRCRSAA
jgi:hypothetical protein